MLPDRLFPRFRPPAEADSAILGLTSGCPHNACTFCGMYRGVPVGLRTAEEFRRHVRLARREFPAGATRIFLGDGDAMRAPTEAILEAMEIARETFPEARRFSLYARPEGILAKSREELRRLVDAGLRTAYLGLETGDPTLLAAIRKGCTVEDLVAAVRLAEDCGLRMSVMALVGLGGRAGSAAHAAGTAEALNRMEPRFASLLTFIPVEGTELHADLAGRFFPLDDREALGEIRAVVAALSCRGTIFRADHASNPLPLAGTLPRDRERLLAEIDGALAGDRGLRPGWLRGL